jgi:hypothetical protein
MARITVTEAAHRGFASRPTLYRAIKDGRITPHVDKGKKLLDVADLVSAFGEPVALKASSDPTPARDQAVAAARIEVDRDRLQDDVDRLRRELEEARKTLETEREDAKQERSEMREIITSTQKLLEDQSKEREVARKGFFKRLFG